MKTNNVRWKKKINNKYQIARPVILNQGFYTLICYFLFYSLKKNMKNK